MSIRPNNDRSPDSAGPFFASEGRSHCHWHRRIATHAQLVSEIAAWERGRNASGARIKWMFTTAKARAKMGRAYPEPISAKLPSAKES